MSLRGNQIAYGRNYTLQKRLDDTYVNIKQGFRYCRRRQDAFEEDCLDSLYKLLIYAKAKQDADAARMLPHSRPATAKTQDDRHKSAKQPATQPPGRSKSVMETKIQSDRKQSLPTGVRPATAMSAMTYTQSYSFQKNGMNIDRSRRDRYMRSQQVRQTECDLKAQLERSMCRDTDMKRKQKQRPKTAAAMTGAPRMLEPRAEDMIPRPSTHLAIVPEHSGRSSTLLYNYKSKEQHLANNNSAGGGIRSPRERHAGRENKVTSKPPPSPRTPSLIVNQDPISKAGESIPIASGEDASDDTENAIATIRDSQRPFSAMDTLPIPRSPTLNGTALPGHIEVSITEPVTRPNTVMDNALEEELLPFSDDDKNQLEELTSTPKPGAMRSYTRSKSAKPSSRSNSTSSTEGLDTSVKRIQSFLADYSKKSRLFGYVMKTRSATGYKGDRLIQSKRSPCITYQELASIKANIKQHESNTRYLLQRSSTLSSYVDKLANANIHREYLKQRKAGHVC